MAIRKIFVAACLCLATLTAAAQKTLEILHTNDTHSCILPLNPTCRTLSWLDAAAS